MRAGSRVTATAVATLVAAALLAGCKKDASCRPGTLLVSVSCGGPSAPGGADHVVLTLKEETHAPPAESFALLCPQTNHEVTIGNYSTTRTLTGSVAIAAGDGPGTIVVADHALPLADGCTVWNVSLVGNGDGGADLPAVETGEVAGDDAGADLLTDAVMDAGGVEVVVTPVPDGGLFANGAGCTADGECASSQCVGGVCCEERCDGKCQVCAAGTGKCGSLPAGTTSPRCSATPDSSTCGETGLCDDKGGCALFGTTTTCKAAACDASGLALIPAAFCDGLGHCVAGQSSDCGAYRCSAGACGQGCTATGDCNGVACVDGQCGGKRGVGAMCDSNSQCDKGFCVDGVCCESACSGTCLACAMAATGRPDGTCAPSTAGTDPRNQCDPQPGCGQDGACDGHGACRKHGSDVTCQAASCDGNHTFTKAATCDGTGACATPTVSECGLYRCSASGCGQAPCANDNDCAAGVAYCDGTTHACVAKQALGSSCVHNDDCGGGPCVKGICCESTCSTGCYSCSGADTGGAMGRCLPVVAGKSDGTCTAKAEATCKETGACNGMGACQMQPITVECQAESCSGTTFTPPSKCDGAGTCVTPPTSDCGPYLCDGNIGCKTTCIPNSPDCASDAICTNGKCARTCCSVDDWCWQNPRPHGSFVRALWGSNANDVWSVADNGLIAHWDGKLWQGTKSVTTANLTSVHGAAGVVWSGGENGTLLKWDGLGWRRTTIATTNNIVGVYAAAANDAWAAAGLDLFRWDGTQWNKAFEIGVSSGYFTAIAGNSPNNIYALSESVIYHWNGQTWTVEWDVGQVMNHPGGLTLADLVFESSDAVWVTVTNDDSGEPSVLIHRTGGTWIVATDISLHNSSHISRSNDGRLWVTNGFGPPYSWLPNAQATPQVISGLENHQFVAVLAFDPNTILFADYFRGAIMKWDGQNLTNTFIGLFEDVAGMSGGMIVTDASNPPFTAVTGNLWSQSGSVLTKSQTFPSTSLRLTDISMGFQPASINSTWVIGCGPTVLKAFGGNWSPLLNGPSATDCLTAVSAVNDESWIVGQKGRIWHGTGTNLDMSVVSGVTNDLNDVVAIGTSDVWIVGSQGITLHKSGSGTFVPVQTGSPNPLQAVCATNAQDLWAVGQGTNTYHGDGTKWTNTVQGLDPGVTFFDVSCFQGEAWTVSPRYAWHWINGAWSSSFTGASAVRILAGSQTVTIAGGNGAVLTHDK